MRPMDGRCWVTHENSQVQCVTSWPSNLEMGGNVHCQLCSHLHVTEVKYIAHGSSGTFRSSLQVREFFQ